jgi:transposase
MQAITTIGLDIAKSVFQVHGIDAEGNVVLRRQLKRRYVLAFFQKLPPCLVGIEACASAHYWSRELQALGHVVRLMPPAYVKPYVKRHKNDATDAEAICEAVTRPNMRFVATKTPEQQSCLTLHRTRHLFIRQQTSVINAIRAHLAEFGIVAPVGRHGVAQLLGIAADANDKRLPEVARACVTALGAQLQTLKARILQFDRMITAWHRSSEASRRLDDIPGVGPALATALVASICRSEGVPIRKGLLGLDRARAEAELEWRQGQAWQYQQTRRSLSAQPVHDRRLGCDPLCQNPWHRASALAHGTTGAATDEGRGHRARQQDRQDGVGDDGQERTLQRTRRARGVNEIASGIRCDVKVGRANST